MSSCSSGARGRNGAAMWANQLGRAKNSTALMALQLHDLTAPVLSCSVHVGFPERYPQFLTLDSHERFRGMASGGSRLKTGAGQSHPQVTPAARRVFRPTDPRPIHNSVPDAKHSAAISDREFVHSSGKVFGFQSSE